MRKKNFLILCLLSISIYSIPAMAENRARVCVTRIARGDITDKFPVNITIDKRELFHLMGGGEKCVSFQPQHPSEVTFTAYSPNLSNPNNRSLKVTHSESFVVKISDGKEVTLQVEPMPFSTQFPEFWKLSLRP